MGCGALSLLQVAPIMLGARKAAVPMAFVSATNATAAGSSVSVNKPTGAQAGDLAVMIASHFGNNPVSTGWTQRQNDATGTIRNRILTRLFDGSEGATFSVTGVGSPDGVTILLFRGGSASFDLAGASYQTTSTTPVAPSLTATQLGILLAIFAHSSNTATISTPPSGMTQRVSFNTGGGGAAIAVYELSPSPVGASGAKTLAWSNSAGNAAVLIQIY